ncbi:uncharacterized protein LOC109703888 isoform X2 [Ananas comosus]|uniref:Uncharacterized protein LOC109703888 isoform X2 n=1 Tax=Ananas comosus TaxID=4615 RepID=A0A6P5EEY0_ANACO|nr:uncharacterized protein LOC109703888 isoform X2 [Ananas comosus]
MMKLQKLPLRPPIPPPTTTIIRRCEAVRAAAADEGGGSSSGTGTGSRRANLCAQRKERIKLPPDYHYGAATTTTSTSGSAFLFSDFLRHPSGVQALLNSRALQSFEPLDSNTYRCTLHRIQFLKIEVAPVMDLRVTPTTEDCTVEMLSCRFEGSEIVKQQNNLFSAFMRNHITWDTVGYEPCLDVDVSLKVTLEVYTKPFSLLPISAVEKPGNLLMQGLLDRLVPLLIEQLLRDYEAWVNEQLAESS